MTTTLAFVFIPQWLFFTLFIAVFIFALYAQMRVSSAYGQNDQIASRGGFS